MKHADLIIKGKYVLTLDKELSIIENGGLAVSGSEIDAVLSEKELSKNYCSSRLVDGGNCIIMPGFVNTHVHAAMSYFRGLADDLPLSSWLQEHIWPSEAKNVNAAFVCQAAELACLEMLMSGTTCFNDMYFFANETAAAAESIGMRAIVGEPLLDFPTPKNQNFRASLEDTEKLYHQYRGSQLIKAAVNPHSIYAADKTVLEEARRLAARYGLPIHIHISETEKEVKDCQAKYGQSPVEYLADIGLFDNPVIGAHSVWLSGNDISIYQKCKVKVSHNPISNLKLASGFMPYKKLREKNIMIGLGTDGPASNNTLDMFSVMRVCALIHKGTEHNPLIAPARDVVKMATIDGAAVLGLEKEIGSLEKGKKADIIVVGLDKAHLSPVYDPYSHLVYAAGGSDISSVIINGQLIMDQGRVFTLDKERVINEAQNFLIKK